MGVRQLPMLAMKQAELEKMIEENHANIDIIYNWLSDFVNDFPSLVREVLSEEGLI